MIDYEIIKCKDFSLCNITATEFSLFDFHNCDYVRIKLPSIYDNQKKMLENNYVWVDRMLRASINLQRSNVNYKKMIRLNIEETSNHIDIVRKIAYESFPIDRRFHVTKEYNAKIAKQIIDYYINNVERWLICFFKDTPIGFIGLVEKDTNEMEIYLAAVDKKYRSSGAANSLYAYACEYCKERNYKKLYGSISSVNMSVMNLYISLGATFLEPKDIFVK